MSAMDFLQVGNIGATKDVIALLAVMLEQATMDGGRFFEVAQVLTLQDDVPYTVFTARQGSVARRAFAPLADQRWMTVALAYLKELETISSKRVEMLSASQTSAVGGGASSQLVPVPKSQSRRQAARRKAEEEELGFKKEKKKQHEV